LANAVDELGKSSVMVDRQELTFRQFYEAFIDAQFADPFLAGLLVLKDLEISGRHSQATVAQKICKLLDAATGFSRDNNDCRMMMIYCLYWWAAFARGYLFEAVIWLKRESDSRLTI
ncbi:MAG: hypothetical protein AAB401_03155, partial [Acidobacteriota bacterium]